MIAIYIVCAVVGVGLALVSAIAGGHGHDADGHIELGHSVDHDGSHDTGVQIWLPFLSLRFWTYGLAGFGLTGLLLSLLTPAVQATVLSAAGGMGLVCGTLIALTMRLAMKSQTDSCIHVRDMLGLDAEVLVAIRPGHPGKVRFSSKGETIDMLAVSDDAAAIEAGHSAIVVAIEGDRARVVPREAIFDDNVLTRS